MARIASTLLVVALLAATATAFALTEGLKLEKSPIFGTRVPLKSFSPVCRCDTESAPIAFRLRTADRLDVTIVRDGEVVRTLVSGRRYRRGAVDLGWDGRDDAGRVVPEGSYRPRVHLRGQRQTITLPNDLTVDVTPPDIESVRVARRVISPDGDHRADSVVVPYSLSEDGRGLLFVNGRRRGLTRYPRPAGQLVWNGKLRGTGLPKGSYELRIAARDRAGNVSARTAPVAVRIRYVTLGRTRIDVQAGERFALRVSADVRTVRWRLGARSGRARPGTLRFRAPGQTGRFTLTVSASGHDARAAVFVRAGAR